MIAEKSADKIKKIIEHLENGGVIVYPTETAYAIGCDATNQKAVDLVFKLKKRAKSKTLPLIAGSLAMVKRYCQMSTAEGQLAKRYWPGAMTMVLKIVRPLNNCHCEEAKPTKQSRYGIAALPAVARNDRDGFGKGIVAKDGTVAVRVSGNKIARKLSRGLGRPIVSTSANLAGKGECYSLDDMRKKFGNCHPFTSFRAGSEQSEGSLALLNGGKLKRQKPSTIVKIENGKIKILRQGEEILRASCLPAGRHPSE